MLEDSTTKGARVRLVFFIDPHAMERAENEGRAVELSEVVHGA